MRLRGHGATLGLIASLAIALAGCLPSTRGPERLYPVGFEIETIRQRQEALVARYYEVVPLPTAAVIRNEIIAQRMYAIDVQYTEYEAALTREGQEVGFGAVTAAEGLSTASTLVVNVATKSVLSAAATAVLATRGHYNSEVLLAQTIRTIQKQMRASRLIQAAKITARMEQSIFDYPLAAALSDLEEYYNAGTLTSGVVDSSTTVGIAEQANREIKQAVAVAPPSRRAEVLASTTAEAVRVLPIVQPPRTVVATYGPDRVTAILRAWLRPNGGINEDHRAILKDYIKTIDPSPQMETFLRSAQYTLQREVFARAQKLIP